MKAVTGLASPRCLVGGGGIAAMAFSAAVDIRNRHIAAQLRLRHLVATAAFMGGMLVVRKARFRQPMLRDCNRRYFPAECQRSIRRIIDTRNLVADKAHTLFHHLAADFVGLLRGPCKRRLPLRAGDTFARTTNAILHHDIDWRIGQRRLRIKLAHRSQRLIHIAMWHLAAAGLGFELE